MNQASEQQARAAIVILERAIEAARNGNQAGENAVVRAARALIQKQDLMKEASHAR